jgi:hypothetical protein
MEWVAVFWARVSFGQSLDFTTESYDEVAQKVHGAVEDLR